MFYLLFLKPIKFIFHKIAIEGKFIVNKTVPKTVQNTTSNKLT